jgi:transcriptional regulator with XRE-family HTH domain
VRDDPDPVLCPGLRKTDLGSGVRIEDVIGYWITRGREETGMTQAQIGEALGEHLDKPWPKQAVSAAEKGRRAFTAAELVAFALVLGATLESLLEPPPDVNAVDLGNGPTLDARHLRTAAATNSDLASIFRNGRTVIFYPA